MHLQHRKPQQTMQHHHNSQDIQPNLPQHEYFNPENRFHNLHRSYTLQEVNQMKKEIRDQQNYIKKLETDLLHLRQVNTTHNQNLHLRQAVNNTTTHDHDQNNESLHQDNEGVTVNEKGVKVKSYGQLYDFDNFPTHTHVVKGKSSWKRLKNKAMKYDEYINSFKHGSYHDTPFS